MRKGHSQYAQIENQKREVLYGHQGVIERTQLRRAQLERGLALVKYFKILKTFITF